MDGATQEAILEVIEPATDRGARFRIASTRGALAGRDPHAELELCHPTVSRRHAEFGWSGADLWVDDRGSRSGTFVNGQRVSTAQLLAPGDRVSLGAVVLRYWPPAGGEPTTLVSAEPTQPAEAASLQVDAQYGQMINNVDGNQYFHYVQRQRDSFLRQVAATKTKARWFTWLGVAVLVVGAAAFGRMVLLFLQAIYTALASGARGDAYVEPDFGGIFDEKLFGLNAGLLGFAVGTLGELMVIIGIVLHITATARRRRMEKDLPLAAAGYSMRS